MPLGSRVLRATLALPIGNIVLDETLDIRIKVHKDALAIQNSCTITVFDLSQSLRESLLSQFTAWNKRNLETGQPGYKASYIGVTVEAGYQNAKAVQTVNGPSTTASSQSSTAGQATTSTVFAGQIVKATPVSSPPNIGVAIECYTQQLSRIEYISNFAPTKTTFKQYVQWAGAQMGVSSVVCETSYDDVEITNPSASTHIVGTLLVDIQNAYRPNVAAFIDNNILYVKDQNKVVSTAQVVTVSEFIGTPLWTEWGVDFMCLFNPQIALAGAATLQSSMNPSLNQTFVISSLDYDLNSRETPFYVRVNANPSA
jgi:hypothetical protein